MAKKEPPTLNPMDTPHGPVRRVVRIRHVIYVLVAVAVLVADQATKALVARSIPDGVVVPVIPGFFNLLHTENNGIAFSLFSGSPSAWKMALLIGISVALLVTVVIVVWRASDINWMGAMGLALILGGACSNLVDRIRFGQVVDFLDFYYRSYHWPTFNVADSAIVVGAGFLVLEFFFAP